MGIIFSDKLDVNIINSESLNDGRGLLVNFQLLEKTFTAVSCYAPNDICERAVWFENLQHWISVNAENFENLIVCGDFNCCYKTNDRKPQTHLNDKSRKSFDNLIQHLNLSDMWERRKENMDNYTWSDGKVRSRLHYILLSKSRRYLLRHCG